MENNTETLANPEVKQSDTIDLLGSLNFREVKQPTESNVNSVLDLLDGKETPATTIKTEEKLVENQVQNSIQTENKTPEIPVENEGQIEIGAEELGSFLDAETGGLIKSTAQLHEIINENKALQERLKVLEDNPASAFKDPNKVALAKFLADYKGGDFHTGIQTFARLSSLDIPKMTPTDALREAYIMDKSQAGISRDDAEKMFDFDFEEKYGNKGELAEKYINYDSIEAKKKLESAKEAFTVEPTKDDDQSVQRETEFKEARQKFEQEVGKSTTGFKSLIFEGLTDNPENDFTYEVENVKDVENFMLEYNENFQKRYVAEGGGWNTELLKEDIAWTLNRDKITQMLFEHGRNIGKEMAIMERQNTPNRNSPPASNHAGRGGTPKTMEEALLKAKVVR